MKRLLILLPLCLFLWGCASRRAPASLPEEETPEPAEVLSLYDPDSTTEAESAGALKVFPLNHLDPTGFFRMEDALYVIGDSEGATHIQRFEGDALTLTHSLALEITLAPEDGFFRFLPGRITYFDPMTLQVVVLDEKLQERQRLPVREDMTGLPILSADSTTLYYCTRDAVRALETETGISRLLKEISAPYQSARALHQEDRILECVLEEADGSRRILLLSTEDGSIVWETGEELTLLTEENRFYAHLSGISGEKRIFGTSGQEPQMLTPACAGEFFAFLPESHGALSARREGDSTILEYYDLSTGALRASCTLSGRSLPAAAEDAGSGRIWLFFPDREEPALLLWNTSTLSAGDDKSRTAAYLTPETSDPEELEQCRFLAEALGEAYGVEIRIPERLPEALQGNWQAEYAYHPQLLREQLEALETRLASLPREIPELFRSRYSGLRILLVQSLRAPEDPGKTTGSLFFWEDTTGCIVLADPGDGAFFEALFGLMDTVIHTRSDAFDRWEELNPMQFSYVGTEPVPEDYDAYLQPDTRAFADKASMTDSRTERCRLFALAMAPGKEDLFRSLTMQKKLSALCEGIREGFGLEKDPAVFPWEQYRKENT